MLDEWKGTEIQMVKGLFLNTQHQAWSAHILLLQAQLLVTPRSLTFPYLNHHFAT